jgi:type IV secretory pathway VirB2 component (pilin)
MFDLIGRAQAAITFPVLNPVTGGTTLDQVLQRVVTWILLLAGTIAVVYLIYGGILYITAGGDAEKAKSGRTAVVNAIIGIVIILLALVIVNWVMSIVTSGTA